MDVLRVRLNLSTIAAFRSEFVEKYSMLFFFKNPLRQRYRILLPHQTVLR